MTQPAAPPPSSPAGKIIAGTALGLALIALETQVSQDIQDTVQTAFKGIAAAALIAGSAPPGVVISGLGLLGAASFHRALTTLLATAREQTRDTISSGYTAATRIAHAHATQELADSGYDVPADIPELPNTLDTILADIDTAFGHAQTDTQNGITEAIADNTPDDHNTAVVNAIAESAARLKQRATAAGTVAVHQGSSDTLNAIYNEYQNDTGIPGLMKRWRTTSTNPCGMCQALDGTMVGINAEFDAQATTKDKDLRRVWRNLLTPPRHPHCRCQLELVATT